MSSQIAAERKDYYLQLESAQRGDTDITGWLVWFLACLDRALDGADEALAGVMNKAKLWTTTITVKGEDEAMVTSKVVAWLKSKPAMVDKPTDPALNTALENLYPCR